MTAEEFFFVRSGKANGAVVLLAGSKIMIRNRIIVKCIGNGGGLIVNTVAYSIGVAPELIDSRLQQSVYQAQNSESYKD